MSHSGIFYEGKTAKGKKLVGEFAFTSVFYKESCRLEYKLKVQLDPMYHPRTRSAYPIPNPSSSAWRNWNRARQGWAENHKAAVAAAAPRWKTAVEAAFNKWKLVVLPSSPPSCLACRCDSVSLDFRVDFVIGSTWSDDFEVKVHSRTGLSNVTNWYYGSPGVSQAPYGTVIHEVGHMFGLRDEYVHAINYPGVTRASLPADAHLGVMGNSSTAKVLKRHVTQVVFLRAKTPTQLRCHLRVMPR